MAMYKCTSVSKIYRSISIAKIGSRVGDYGVKNIRKISELHVSYS